MTDVRVKVSLLSMGTPLPIELDILGWSDSLILMVLALVVFGPRRLPQIGRQIGKLMYEFRKASNEFKFQMEEELRAAEEADRRKKEEERLRALALKASPTEPAAALPAGSPYREDAVYPASVPAAPPADPEPAPAESQPSAQAEDTYPRVQPPSTGEQIAATRPGPIAGFEIHAEAGGQNGSGSGPERDLIAAAEPLPPHEAVSANTEDAHAVTEQAAQHG